MIIAVAFGEMELTPITYWSLIITTAAFIISFALSSIPLANNINRGKDLKRKIQSNSEEVD